MAGWRRKKKDEEEEEDDTEAHLESGLQTAVGRANDKDAGAL